MRPQKKQLICRAYADGADLSSGLDEADDFYSILGVVRLLLSVCALLKQSLRKAPVMSFNVIL